MAIIVFDLITLCFVSLAAFLYFYLKKKFFAFLIVSSGLLRIIHVNKLKGVSNIMKYPFWAMSVMLTYLSLAARYSSFRVPKNPPLASAIVMVACTLPLLLLILLDNVTKRYQAKKISLPFAIIQIVVGLPMLLFSAFFVAIFIFTPLLSE